MIEQKRNVTIHTDGGARGNPGPAAIGVVIEVTGEPKREMQKYLGEMTNNQAEYRAVLAALDELERLSNIASAEFVLDSELVVKQIRGEYRVKEPALQPHHRSIRERIAALDCPVTFRHVRRAENAEADALVNAALDERARNDRI